VLTRWSTELNEDAIIEMADNLAMDIAKAFAYAEDNALFNGDGTSTYHGIVGIRVKLIDGSHDGSKVDAASGHDTFAEIDATDLANVKALVPDYVTNPYWLCSRQFKSLVFDRLAMAAGGVSKVEVGGRPNDAYDGDPIFTANAMPRSTGDLSDVVMALYGDLRPGVKFGSRRGMMIATTDQRYWELDQLGIKGTERFDINCHTLKGLDEDGTSAVAGPVIGLVGE
jgi:HK97 family phage major capsid protein